MTEKDYDIGFKCASCGSFVKQYRRKLSSNMAIVLILLYKANHRSYRHIENWLKEIGRPELRADYHKLRFWNLIEAKPGQREDGSTRNGYYKITGRGLMFAEGKLQVQKYVILLHNEFQRFEGDLVNVKDCLREKFHYNDMMGHFAPRTDKEAKELNQLSIPGLI